jgi:hypothetical protein
MAHSQIPGGPAQRRRLAGFRDLFPEIVKQPLLSWAQFCFHDLSISPEKCKSQCKIL